MSLSALKTAVTSQVGLKSLVVKKHSPAILLGVGAVGFGATVFLACRATLKLDEVLDQAQTKQQEFEEGVGKPLKSGGEYTEEDAKQDGLTNRVKTAIKIAKLYAPAVIVGGVTLAAITGSYRILNARNAGLSAAYAAVDKAFKQYRGRVIEKHGKEADAEFRFGRVERQIGVETDEGIAEKTVAGADPEFAEKSNGESMYARIFSPANNNWDSFRGRNVAFLKGQQQWANDVLQGKGYIMLNDVYKMLGLGYTTAGAYTGWIWNNKNGGDNYVDFGFLDKEGELRDEVVTPDGSIWLDFNVDGVVADLLDEVV
jgi:hypothetical protein